ncbi:hypothetical protein GCM10027051_35800 [Niabella terrae]
MRIELRFIVYLLLLLAITVFGCIHYKKLSTSFRLIVLFIGYTFLSELGTRFLKNGGPFYHFFIPVQYLVLTGFYSFYLEKFRTLLNWSAPVFVLLCIINLRYYQSVYAIPSNPTLVAGLIITICALLLFQQMLKSLSGLPIYRQELFWFNTGVLIQFSITFFCWSFYNYFRRTGIDVGVLMNMVYYIGLLYNCFIGVALYLNARNHKSVNDHAN